MMLDAHQHRMQRVRQWAMDRRCASETLSRHMSRQLSQSQSGTSSTAGTTGDASLCLSLPSKRQDPPQRSSFLPLAGPSCPCPSLVSSSSSSVPAPPSSSCLPSSTPTLAPVDVASPIESLSTSVSRYYETLDATNHHHTLSSLPSFILVPPSASPPGTGTEPSHPNHGTVSESKSPRSQHVASPPTPSLPFPETSTVVVPVPDTDIAHPIPSRKRWRERWAESTPASRPASRAMSTTWPLSHNHPYAMSMQRFLPRPTLSSSEPPPRFPSSGAFCASRLCGPEHTIERTNRRRTVFSGTTMYSRLSDARRPCLPPPKFYRRWYHSRAVRREQHEATDANERLLASITKQESERLAFAALDAILFSPRHDPPPVSVSVPVSISPIMSSDLVSDK